MKSIWDIIYLRRPPINYVSPPVCEVIFSGSSHPVIILSQRALAQVSGLVLGGFSGFRLSWNAYPGAICFNIYHIAEGTDVAVILAECVPGNDYELPQNLGPGTIVITVITLEGESDPSDPIVYGSGGAGTSTVSVQTECRQASRSSFPITFRIAREVGDLVGNLVVHFTLTGTAVNGTHYSLLPLTATIPNGSDEVIVSVVPIEAALLENMPVIITLTQPLQYAIDPLFATAAAELIFPNFRISDYGTMIQPLFTLPAGALDSDFCEWDGTWNTPILTGAPDTYTYFYKDANGQLGNFLPDPLRVGTFVELAIGGKQLFFPLLNGPETGDDGPEFQLQILAVDADSFHWSVVWQGYKHDSTSSAEGIYTSFGPFGSDPRLTVTLTI